MKYWFFSLLIASLLGCDRPSDDLKNLKEDIKSLASKTERQIDSLASNPSQVTDAATAEVEKLFTFEYKVHPLTNAQSATQVEAMLNRLGQEHWECFQIMQVESDNVAICKRAPKSYLRYLKNIAQ